jgi:hypothetical protein
VVFALIMAWMPAVPASAGTLPPGGSFIDDNGSVHEPDIEALAAADITRGCNPPANDRFCPGDSVTRGQMAAFLVRALELPAATGPDRFSDDDTSEFEADIEALAAADVTRGCNPPDNDRFCPANPVTRAEMATFIVRAEGLSPITPPPPVGIALDVVASGLTSPVHVATPPGDDRLFIVEKGGVIKILDGGDVLPEPFLDVSSEVDEDGGEMGLLSMAFHPDYATNGRFFVYYSDNDGSHQSVIAEYQVSSDPNVADPTEDRVLVIDQPNTNHNGGHLLFGPDGYLYVGLGDGGGGGDPDDNGQDPATLLGSILRLDVSTPGTYSSPPDNPYVGTAGADEIWAIGLRNPWRMWFDNGLLYVADVGQDAYEEVSVVDSDAPGLNYGWNILEGKHCYPASANCSAAGTVVPVAEHSHSAGWISVTGGVVYRGTALPQLTGRYLYADLVEGHVRTLLMNGTSLLETGDLTSEIGVVSGVWSFGADNDGEIYLVRGGAGTVVQLVAG